MNIDDFKDILFNLYSKDMCYIGSQSFWDEDNPCVGMCAITSMLVQDYFNYDIAKIKVDGTSHYFNVCNGKVIDLTKEQFNQGINYYGYEVVDRSILNNNKDTMHRYLLLKNAFIEHMKNHFYMRNVFGEVSEEEAFNFQDDTFPTFCLAVITIMKDGQNRFVLQRRGAKARDEVGMLEEIGGAFEDKDQTLKNAMIREIQEEVGTSAKILVHDILGGFIHTKYDQRTNSIISWLFVLYDSSYIEGDLLINEPMKCNGYEYYSYDNLPWNDMSDSSKMFNRYSKKIRGGYLE